MKCSNVCVWEWKFGVGGRDTYIRLSVESSMANIVNRAGDVPVAGATRTMPLIAGIRDGLRKIRGLTRILGERVRVEEDRNVGRGTAGYDANSVANYDFHAAVERYEDELYTEWDGAWDCNKRYASFYVLMRKLDVFAKATQETVAIEEGETDVWGTRFIDLLNALIVYMRTSAETLRDTGLNPNGLPAIVFAKFWESTEMIQLQICCVMCMTGRRDMQVHTDFISQREKLNQELKEHVPQIALNRDDSRFKSRLWRALRIREKARSGGVRG